MASEAAMLTREGYKQTEIGEIPESWRVASLGELSSKPPAYGSGASAREHDSSLPRYVRITDITGCGQLSEKSKASLTREEASGYYLTEGDLLLARSGATVGKSFIYTEEHGECAHAGYLIKFAISPILALPLYVFLWTQSDEYWRWIRRTFRQGAQPNINAKEYAAHKLALPPLPEQQAIAEVLQSVDDSIRATQEVLDQQRVVKQGLLQQLLTRGIGHTRFKRTEIGEIPESWEVVDLSELCEFITKGTTPTTLGYGWVEEGILFLRSECVSESGFRLKGSQRILPEAHSAMSRSVIRGGDLLMTITGNVGRVCRFPAGLDEANINQHIARIRIVQDTRATPEFVSQALSTSEYRRYYNRILTGLAYPQLSLKQVRETPVPLPPFREQQAIAEVLQSVDDSIGAEQEKLAQLDTLKRGLMQDLLTGKVRVTVTP